MTLKERLTEAQQKQVDAEQKRYNTLKAKEGKNFDPLDHAPTADGGKENDPVQQAIHKIWSREER